MTMIEKVADAFEAAWDSCDSLPPIILSDAERHHLAHAAIEAMAEPSEAMVDEGFRAREHGMTMEQSARATWSAMIRAALTEDQGGEG